MPAGTVAGVLRGTVAGVGHEWGGGHLLAARGLAMGGMGGFGDRVGLRDAGDGGLGKAPATRGLERTELDSCDKTPTTRTCVGAVLYLGRRQFDTFDTLYKNDTITGAGRAGGQRCDTW